MTVSRRPTGHLSAAAVALYLMMAALSVQPTSALICASELDSDTYAGARKAVTHPGEWDGLVVGTVTAVERKDDHWRTRVLVVEPGVVFSGDLRDTVRVEIGGHGPEMGFAAGATYFLSLTRSGDPGATPWFLHPCGANVEITSIHLVAQLRATSDSEIVISEPAITGTPGVVWAIVAIATIALAGTWLMRRTRATLPAAG